MHTTSIHTNAISRQLVDAPTTLFDFGHLFALLLSKAWLIVLFAAFSLLAAVIYLKLAPKLYESRIVIEVESKSGQAKLTQRQSAQDGELLERQANLTKAKAERDSALAELEADERLSQRGLISALDFKKAQIAANELSANYEVEKQRYETQRINNVQDLDTGDNGGNSNLDEDIKTVEQAIVSDTLLLGVLKSNGLEKDPSFAPPKKDGSAYLDSELVDRFRSRVKAAVRHGTRLIDLTVQDTDPKRAQQIAEAIVKTFIDQNAGEPDANNRLGQEADQLKAKLQGAEQAVEKYRQDPGSAALESNQKIVADKLKDLNLKVTQAKSDRQKLEADVAVIKQSKNPQDLLALPSIASAPQVASLRQQLSDQESKNQTGSQLTRSKRALDRAIVDAANAVNQTYENAKATEATLTNALHEQEQKALELNKTATPYNALVREVEADRALYESVVKRMKVTYIDDGISGKNIRVVDTPLVAAKPLGPDPLKTLLLALMIGITGGCGLVVSIGMADNSIRTVDQAERISNLTALAAIPESKRRNRKREPVLTADPASFEAEAFRSLRTSLSFLDSDTENRTLLFTSANPGEGKTYCCLNYSVALAKAGFRTLLIDADIRRPRLSKIALADEKAQGLTDCLMGQANVIDCCKPTGIENLFLLPAGQTRSTPSELFASCDFVSLLTELAAHFDRIVLDSAPINAVSDTQLIARHVHSICFVIRSIKTPADAITRACALLRKAGTSPDGFVFNRMPTRSRDSHYYSEYAGGYGNGATEQKLKAELSNGHRSNQENNWFDY